MIRSWDSSPLPWQRPIPGTGYTLHGAALSRAPAPGWGAGVACHRAFGMPSIAKSQG